MDLCGVKLGGKRALLKVQVILSRLRVTCKPAEQDISKSLSASLRDVSRYPLIRRSLDKVITLAP